MSFRITFDDGKKVTLDDLSPDTFDAIAATEGDTSWWAVYLSPCANGARMYAVACAAADFAGTERPSKPSNMVEAKLILDLYEQIPDVGDGPVIDGFPPMPSETESGSSSGVPAGSDGLPT